MRICTYSRQPPYLHSVFRVYCNSKPGSYQVRISCHWPKLKGLGIIIAHSNLHGGPLLELRSRDVWFPYEPWSSLLLGGLVDMGLCFTNSGLHKRSFDYGACSFVCLFVLAFHVYVSNCHSFTSTERERCTKRFEFYRLVGVEIAQTSG